MICLKLSKSRSIGANVLVRYCSHSGLSASGTTSGSRGIGAGDPCFPSAAAISDGDRGSASITDGAGDTVPALFAPTMLGRAGLACKSSTPSIPCTPAAAASAKAATLLLPVRVMRVVAFGECPPRPITPPVPCADDANESSKPDECGDETAG